MPSQYIKTFIDINLVIKGAVSALRGVSQISNSFVWIDILLDKDYSDMHKNAKNAILANLWRITILA